MRSPPSNLYRKPVWSCWLAIAMVTIAGSASAQIIRTHCVKSSVDQAAQQQFGPPPVGKTWESMSTCTLDDGRIFDVSAQSQPIYRRGVCISYTKTARSRGPAALRVIMSQKGRCPAPSGSFYIFLGQLTVDEFRAISNLDLQGEIRKKYPHSGKLTLSGMGHAYSGFGLFPEYQARFETSNSELVFYEVRVFRLPFDIYVIRDVSWAEA